MPIDREKGEHIAILGPHDAVQKPEVFKEYCSHLKLTIERPKRNGKFGKEVVEYNILELAAEQASEAFLAQGALLPIIFDDTSWICQEYHSQGLIVLIAQHKIKGQDHYAILPFGLTKGQVRWLVDTQRWKLKGGKSFDELERKPIANSEDLPWLSQSAGTLH